MPESILSNNFDQTTEATNLRCCLCGRVNEQRIPLCELRPEIRSLLKGNAADTGELTEICVNCIDLFNRARTQIDSHHIVFEQTDHVLPTPLRMNADERFTG